MSIKINDKKWTSIEVRSMNLLLIPHNIIENEFMTNLTNIYDFILDDTR